MEDIVPRLAAALSELHRAPDKATRWVDHVLPTFERERPDGHTRLRRRLGFAGRLADFACLADEDRATMTVGLFFAALVEGSPPCQVASAPRPWMEYLLRNEDWLAPFFRLAQLLDVPDPSDSMAVELARTAMFFDSEALVHGSRPLQVLQSIRGKASTPDAERAAEFLWSEEGQELCDLHVRHRGRQYTLESSDIRDGIDLLQPASAPPPAEPVEAPLRLSGAALGPRGGKSGPADDPEPGAAALESDAFERRKRALRLGPGLAELPGVGAWEAQEPDRREQPGASGPGDALGVPDPAQELRPRLTAGSTPEPGTETSSPHPTPKTAALHTDSNEPSCPELPRSVNLLGRLEELGIKLQQIEQAAAEGQEFLASLAQQLEELSTGTAEADSAVNRWQRPA